MFSASVKGVKASANLYSLIETVKSNGLESNTYSPVSVHRTAEGRNG